MPFFEGQLLDFFLKDISEEESTEIRCKSPEALLEYIKPQIRKYLICTLESPPYYLRIYKINMQVFVETPLGFQQIEPLVKQCYLEFKEPQEWAGLVITHLRVSNEQYEQIKNAIGRLCELCKSSLQVPGLGLRCKSCVDKEICIYCKTNPSVSKRVPICYDCCKRTIAKYYLEHSSKKQACPHETVLAIYNNKETQDISHYRCPRCSKTNNKPFGKQIVLTPHKIIPGPDAETLPSHALPAKFITEEVE